MRLPCGGGHGRRVIHMVEVSVRNGTHQERATLVRPIALGQHRCGAHVNLAAIEWSVNGEQSQGKQRLPTDITPKCPVVV